MITEPLWIPNEPWALLLVNPWHPLPAGFVPEIKMLSAGKNADVRIAPIMERMFSDAASQGVPLLLRSGYRSVEYQEELYQRKIRRVIQEEGVPESQAPDRAAMVVARPGTSEHHTGLAFDILSPEHDVLDEGFESTCAFAWLQDHAVEYGLVLRYPADKTEITGIVYEPWHWRFVGANAAREMTCRGMCLEEYWDLEKPMLD